MKKPSSKIRENSARLQEQLKQAETREAERLGRLALKAGIGDFEIDESDLQSAFEDVAIRFRDGNRNSTTTKPESRRQAAAAPIAVAASARSSKEA